MRGLRLTFRLAGINNQNFLMRDEETGTFWQQISGLAVSGPLQGERLTLVPSDELTLALWKSERPNGTVLKDVAEFTAHYAKKDWDVKMQKTPTVLSHEQVGMKPRTLVIGVRAAGEARAYPQDAILEQKLVQDRLGSLPIVIVVGPDDQSLRGFVTRLPGSGQTLEFYRLQEGGALMMDDATGSRWNFQGCAIEGKSIGNCLQRVEIVKDYWFDWREYNVNTSVYSR